MTKLPLVTKFNQFLLTLSIGLGLLHCGTKKTVPPKKVALEDLQTPSNVPEGVVLDVKEGKERYVPGSRDTVAKTQKLTDKQTSELLARLSPLQVDGGDKKAFALREKSQPAPRPGKEVALSFPSKQELAPPAVATDQNKGPLEVLRFGPEGDVPLAGKVSVTFNHPMVAITSHSDTVAKGVPVSIEPKVAGKWRWIGTKTLLFDPPARMPQSTTYTVSIPAGTTSTVGGKLAQKVSFQFTTSPLRLESSWPNAGNHQVQEVMFASFDQAVDKDALLATMKVTAGKANVAIRLATEAEIAKSEQVKKMIARLEADERGDRYIAFIANQPLPKDTAIEVTFPKGSPSAEGPNKTKSSQSFSYHTYPPLKIEEAKCHYRALTPCHPGSTWWIRFNNPLDVEHFDPASIKITPELEGRKVWASHRQIRITGVPKPMTSYTVTIPSTVKDEFEQTLGKEEQRPFFVGDYDPSLWGESGFITVDPFAKKPTFDVFVTKHKTLDVTLYAVTPADFTKYSAYLRDSYVRNTWTYRKPPGKKVHHEKIKVPDSDEGLQKITIDLTKAFKGKTTGHVLVDVRAPRTSSERLEPRVFAWAQATQIGLHASNDNDNLAIWASDLKTGAALTGVAIAGKDFAQKATSSAGKATFPLPKMPSDYRWDSPPQYIVASKAGDTAILRGSPWFKDTSGTRHLWHVFDDRSMYKPGETVSVKGWIRKIEYGGDIAATSASKLSYQVYGPRGNKLSKGTTPLSSLGGFDFSFELPKTPNLGNARIELSSDNAGRRSHTFQIQEFRRPEYQVNAKASQGPHMVGENASITVEAKYYAGGSLIGADTNWDVSTASASFRPPNQDKFQFGVWTPWWMNWRGGSRNSDDKISQRESVTGKTDATGKHTIDVTVASVKPSQPIRVSANARVTDVNRQTWASSASLLVHPSDFYIGLKSQRYFYKKGDDIKIDAIAVDHDGKAIKNATMTVNAVRLDWTYVKGEYKELEKDAQQCVVTSKDDAVECKFNTKNGGRYRITGTVADSKGRSNRTVITTWVSGGNMPKTDKVDLETVRLIPNQDEYKPGDTAEILVRSPFFPAHGILSLRRSGIVETKMFKMTASSTTISVPLKDIYTPNLHVQVDLVGASDRTNDKGEKATGVPPRPAHATGNLNLKIPPNHREIQIEVTPKDEKLSPGAKSSVAVTLTRQGKPVPNAEVALVVVDESIWSLTGYEIANPLNDFYPERSSDVRDIRSRTSIRLASLVELSKQIENKNRMDEKSAAPTRKKMKAMRSRGRSPGAPMSAMAEMEMADEEAGGWGTIGMETEELIGKGAGGGGLGYGAGASAPKIAVRSDFNALAHFAPRVKTDANGKANVSIKMPDNLTRYRVVAVAVAEGTYFGKGESSVTARLPLMVRPSAPRFLNFGDKFEMPIVLQNQTDKPMNASVAIRGSNVSFTAGQGKSVSIPANDRVEVRFAAAAEMAGTARFQVATSSGSYADAGEVAFPVWTPATTEAFATYGTIDSGSIKQPVAMPSDAVTQFGGLKITTSSTQLQALTDALIYLVDYPFDCAEQRSSRILSIAGLRDVLEAFEADGLPSKAKLEAFVRRDLKALENLQNNDGGFSFWRRGYRSWPFVSLHVLHAYTRAKEKGFTISERSFQRATRYAKNIERHIPGNYSQEARDTIVAYSLYVRSLSGDFDNAKGNDIIARIGLKKGNLQTIAWLYNSFARNKAGKASADKIHRALLNRVSETAGAANFVTSYSDGAHLVLHSSRRVDGTLLEGLIYHNPKSTLIPKVVKGLLAHKKKGKWGNTQENVFILLALDKYFHTFEKITPNFVAKMWLGGQFAGQHKFKGRTTENVNLDVPMDYIAKQKNADLILQKDGKGRMYYRIGMQYAPKSLWLPAADHGFTVLRSYEAVDDPKDVTRLKDGTWKVKAGARVKVNLQMIAESRRYHVALVDPLPAGFETLNPDLAVTEDLPQDTNAKQTRGYGWWWWRPWYEHQNMRDERVEAFASLLYGGAFEYSYFVRATTPGNFVTPPTRAEEMYSPETFGRSSSDRVIVE